jgi:hypothetical protein
MRNGRQHNLRLSRQLRPDHDSTTIGPLSYEVVEPLKTIRLVVDPGDHGFALDLLWDGMLPPHEEGAHFSRTNGRATADYRRFDQAGWVSGWVELAGDRFVADRWWGIRDHSWGVRPGVGGFEPLNGPPAAGLFGRGGLFFWMTFMSETGTGYAQIHEDSDGNRLMLDGHLRFPDGKGGAREVPVVDAHHELQFYEGTRILMKMRATLVPAEGKPVEIEGHRLFGAPWAFIGTGYDGGYDDRQGLGVYRGEYRCETDVYDVSHPERVVLPGGEEIHPGHREGPFGLLVDGQQAYAHCTIMPVGTYRRYGFE